MKDKSKRLTVVNTGKKPSEKKEVQQVVVRPSSSSSSHAPGFNPNLYLLKSVWDSVFEIKTDGSGQKYIFGKLPVVTKYGITMYADDGNVDIPQLAEGLPFDQRTIWFNPETKQIEVIGGTGGGEGGVSNFWDLSGIPSWITSTKPTYSYSEIQGTPDLSGYATTSALNAVSTKLNDFLEGSDTDTVINKWKELETFLSGLTESDNLATILTGKADKSYVDTNFVTIAGTEDVTGLHNFVNGLKIGGVELVKKQDDVVYLDGNLVVKGGITMYGDGEGGSSAPLYSTLGSLLNVDESNDAVASVDRVLFQSAGSNVWTWKPLSEIGGGSSGGGSVSGDYLPLSGGTLTAESYPLKINVTNANYSAMTFLRNGVEMGSLGFYSDGVCYIKEGTNAELKHVIHSGNISSYNAGSATKLQTARTIWGKSFDGTGNVDGKFTLSGTDASSSQIAFTRDGYSYITGKTLSFGPSSDAIDRMLILTSGRATFQCDILPSAHVTYSLGTYGNCFKNSHINVVYSGDATNNLWLVGGNSANTYGVVIGRNGTAATSGSEICRFNANGMVWASGVYGDIRTTDTNIYLRRAGLNTNTVFLGNGYFSPYSEATDLLQLGRPTARWKGVFVGIGTSASNEYGLQFCDTSDNYIGRISHSTNMGIYSTGDIIIRGGCTKGTSNLTASSTGLRVYSSGDILATGGITMYSDIRKKTKLQDVELSLSQIANAPLIQHYYNSDQDKTTHVGSIAQYWASLNDWFCKLDNEGFYTMEIQNCALASAISIARHLEKYESKTDKTIRKMKQRIQELEDKLEKLEGGNYGSRS